MDLLDSDESVLAAVAIVVVPDVPSDSSTVVDEPLDLVHLVPSVVAGLIVVSHRDPPFADVIFVVLMLVGVVERSPSAVAADGVVRVIGMLYELPPSRARAYLRVSPHLALVISREK